MLSDREKILYLINNNFLIIKGKIELKDFIKPFQLKIDLDGLTNHISSLLTIVVVNKERITYNRNYNFENDKVTEGVFIWHNFNFKPESKIFITLRNYVAQEESNIEINISDYFIMDE